MQKLPYKHLHLNRPQIKSLLVQAHEEYDVLGRGTGKTEGIIAPRSAHDFHSMPRSSGVFLGSTYQQLLTRTLPPLFAGWERMGYKKDIHYFIGKKPPKSWKWEMPYVCPISSDYYVHWYTGAGAHLVSQDRPGSANGMSIDWIKGDEAKLLNKERLDADLIPTNRGNRQYFGHLPEHHSLLFCTDMPTSTSGKWILDKREDMDQEQINLIIAIRIHIIKLEEESRSANKTNQKRLIKEINKFNEELRQLRFNSVLYQEASTFENIDVVGLDYIKQMKRTLSPIEFRAAILGERITKVDGGFYAWLDIENKHGYDSYDYTYIDGLQLDFNALSKIDCRQDGDVNRVQPLDIALDYGSSINCIVTGQEHGDEFRFLSSMHILKPEIIPKLVHNWCDYYEYHRNKEVNYYYDHTAKGTDGMRTTGYHEEVERILISRGWKVNMIDIGQAPGHHGKYLLWAIAGSEEDSRIKKVRFNKTNCKYLIISMDQAQVKEGKNGFEKQKKDEQNKKIAQEETTHHSDAADTLYFGKYASSLKKEPDFIDYIMG